MIVAAAASFAQEGRNVWRSSLDAWLSQKAKESGAEVREETAVVACEEQDGHVSLTMKGDRTYMQTSRYVIVCEDAAGTLKKKRTGKGTPYSMIY